MSECGYQQHVWESSTIQEGPVQASMAVRCAICHVGYLLRLDGPPVAGETMQVGYWVFPAEGEVEVSRDITTHALQAFKGTVNDLRGDGINVIPGTPVIGGPTPNALAKHRNFMRMPG
jgi:hypothetical protein